MKPLGLTEVTADVVRWSRGNGLTSEQCAEFVGYLLDEWRDDRDGYLMCNLSNQWRRFRGQVLTW